MLGGGGSAEAALLGGDAEAAAAAAAADDHLVLRPMGIHHRRAGVHPLHDDPGPEARRLAAFRPAVLGAVLLLGAPVPVHLPRHPRGAEPHLPREADGVRRERGASWEDHARGVQGWRGRARAEEQALEELLPSVPRGGEQAAVDVLAGFRV